MRISKKRKLKSSLFFIKANSFEQHCLWKEYKDEINWEEDKRGFVERIGYIDEDKNKQVLLLFTFAKIYGKRICFFEVLSRYSDSLMVEAYFTRNYPVKWDNGTRNAFTDAMNFHLVINACKS